MVAPAIALLGPLSIDGASAALSPRDRVVLTALAIHVGESVSAERLADALWDERPPASWHKVVPGCVLRLRRALGAGAIETTPYGYRLAVAADDVDAQRFERLLRRGHELLALGEPERAHHTLEEALELWRGQPLLDLDGWEPARIEAQRLTELRLEAEECRLDAAMRVGRHAQVVAQAQSAAAAAPLRERRWALLALAQYQSGRQADALETLHRARALLRNQLGLDPGPDLVELEGAILRQDPALAAPPVGPNAGAVCPYLGLFCYDVDDADAFFGRDAEVAECLRRLETAGALAVVGPSGSGKSSLVRAGVAAALLRAGRRPVLVTAGSRPTAVLTDTPPANTVLIVDQFEEVFTLCTDPLERQEFFAGLAAQASRCPVVICLRADYLSGLVEHPDMARLVERSLYLLGPMDEAGLRAAITGPAESVGLLLEPGLVDLLVREVDGQPGALPLLSHALRRTWERRDGRTLSVEGYQATGGIRGSVAQSAELLYESLTAAHRALLRQVLLRLVSAAKDGDPVRTRVLRRLLLSEPERDYIVERLVAARLVTADGETVQIAHESLARAWPRLANWLEEDVEGQRILRHLSASADAWDGMGRPDSEVYRGARLDQALEWLHAGHSDLTAIETAFVDAGARVRDEQQRAIEQQARQRVRTRRRTRMLVAGVAALLVAALVAGLLAVNRQHEREAADLAAVLAAARRVDDASRNTPDVDHALLLALEAVRLHDSAETRGVFTDLLSAHPALVRSLSVPEPVQGLAISPDGKALLVGEGDGGTMIYRTETVTRAASFPAVPGWTLEYRADGAQLLLAGRGLGGLGEDANELSAAVMDPGLSTLHRLQASFVHGLWVYANDAAYSADGRRLAVYAQGIDSGVAAVDSAVAVWDDADLDRPVLTLQPLMSFAVALSPDGRLLYVGTRDPALRAIDVATGRTVNSVALSGAIPFLPAPANEDDIWHALSDGLEVSPDGKTLAVAEGNDVVLYDSATLIPVHRLRSHTDLVRSLQFSRDGALLASGSADHTAIVWDVATGEAVLRLTGHSDAVLGLAFSSDDGTLYTGGLDRHLLVWDLAGRRQFASRIVDSQRHRPNSGLAVPSPDGRAVVYVGSPVTGENIRFLDVATGTFAAAIANPGGDPIATWLPPDDRRAVTGAGRELRVWDRGTNRLVDERTVAPGDITALAASPDGAFVVVGERTGGVTRVDGGSLLAAGPRVQLDHPVKAVAAAPGDAGVALLDDNSYAVVDFTDGRVRQRGNIGLEPSAAALSPDGDRLAIGGSSGEVGLFDLASQEWIAAPTAAHAQFVDGVSFAADAETVVTSSFDGGVRVWDGRNGALVGSAQVGQQHSPAVATVPPGGSEAIVATRDGSVYRLDTRFDTWIDFGCALAGRSLTTGEWQAVFGDLPYHETCPAGA